MSRSVSVGVVDVVLRDAVVIVLFIDAEFSGVLVGVVVIDADFIGGL